MCEGDKCIEHAAPGHMVQRAHGKRTPYRRRLSKVFCYFPGSEPRRKKIKIVTTKGSGGGGRGECCHVNRAEGFSVLKLSVVLQHSGNFPCFVYHAQLSLCTTVICPREGAVPVDLDCSGVPSSLSGLLGDKVRATIT